MDINVAIPYTELERRKHRIKAAYRLQQVRPTPVLPCFLPRYWLSALGIRHGDYFHSAELMLRAHS
jgi:hypothetical protein